ncbi:MAG TPA: NADPH-dependent FMN reductase [Candidatus Dormibacteraeota bacterium]|nr:NADPH-dependent FMN reductase [Candidatus Dormibacteraeota bacterium]
MKNFIALVGTNSDHSTNRNLLEFIQKHFAGKANIEICEIKDLPVFNKPDSQEPPVEVENTAQKINEADGVIISTPEYNHSIPAVLKNAFEWFTFTTRPFVDKPVMITGASYGKLGSSRAQQHLRQILDSPEVKARIMPSSEFLLGNSLQAFDDAGKLKDNRKINELEMIFDDFIQFVEITNQLVGNKQSRSKDINYFSWRDN